MAKRLDLIAEETERGWVGAVASDGGLKFERMVRGVKEVASLDMALIGSQDARHIDLMTTTPKGNLRHSADLEAQGWCNRNQRTARTSRRHLRQRPQGPVDAAL